MTPADSSPPSKRWLVGMTALALLVQLGALPWLYLRWVKTQQTPAYHDALLDKLALYQDLFHALGSVLLGALLWTLRGATPENERSARPTLVVLMVSLLHFALWAVRGFPLQGGAWLYAGILGFVLGLSLPLWSIRALKRSEAPKDLRRRLFALYALTWIWSLLFALSQFLTGLAA